MALPVGFAWSLLGFAAAQVYLQQQQQREKGGKAGWLSPLLAGAVAANVGVAWHASIMGWGHLGGLSRFYAGEVRFTRVLQGSGLWGLSREALGRSSERGFATQVWHTINRFSGWVMSCHGSCRRHHLGVKWLCALEGLQVHNCSSRLCMAA